MTRSRLGSKTGVTEVLGIYIHIYIYIDSYIAFILLMVGGRVGRKTCESSVLS